jgi:large subunit ribosomal protein L23
MSVLKKPIISEKLNLLQERRGQYGFIVDRKATKPEIKKAIEEYFEVEVVKLNTMITSRKSRKNRKTGQITGKTNSVKKAIFSLKDGQSIDYFENV